MVLDPNTPVKTSFTTANGDGLTFDSSNMLSVFDEVALIAAEESPLPMMDSPQKTPEPELKLEDLAPEVNPAAILVESIEQLILLKPDLVSMSERDIELRNFIKDLPKKAFKSINTCSYTLEALVTQLKTSMDNEFVLREREAAARKSLHNQRMQLAAERAKS